MVCKSCGNNIKSDFKFCPYCGERTVSDFHDHYENLMPPVLLDEEDDASAFYAAAPDEPPSADSDYYIFRPSEPPEKPTAAKRELPPILDTEEDFVSFEPKPIGQAPRAQTPAPEKRPGVGLPLRLLLILLMLGLAAGVSWLLYWLLIGPEPFQNLGFSAMFACFYRL